MFDKRLGATLARFPLLLLPLILALPHPAWSASAPSKEHNSVQNEQGQAFDTRPFLMGFTPFHFSWIEDRLTETYAMVNKHSDLIAYHFDEGVPWPEAYAGKPFHANVEAELKHRREQVPSGGKVYVATTPINFERDGLADYWEEKEQLDRPGAWEDKALDDPGVIQAYIAYCERLIETFQPAYFVYGVEVNLLAANNPEAYKQFQTLAAAVYPALKKKYPKLPIALSFYLHPPDRWQETAEQVKPLLPYTDLYAISTYPYMAIGSDGFAVDEIPENWFRQTRKIAPGKPFAIAETGYIAEDFTVLTKTMPGSPEGQKRYAERMLREAAELDAQFVIWFVIADYDELWGVLKWVVMFNPLIRAWKDTGLYDGDLNPRPALQVWDEWLAKPVRR
jgi:hypothetical protein